MSKILGKFHTGEFLISVKSNFDGLVPGNVNRMEPQCGDCFKIFTKKSQLRDHMEMHVKSPGNFCPFCNRFMAHWRSIKRHVSRVHPSKRQYLDTKSQRLPDSDFFYFCDLCKMGFSTSDKLHKHLSCFHRSVSTVNLKQTGQLMNNDSLDDTELANARPRNFMSNTGLQKHLISHTKTKSCKFKPGKKLYPNISPMQENKHHIQPEPRYKEYVCEKCGKSYTRIGKLKLHIKSTHLADYRCICEICGKTCSELYKLQVHMTVHNENMKYKCDICNAVLKSKTTIIRHIQSHFGMLPVEKYDCPICRKILSGSQSYKQHQLIHTGQQRFHCMCGKVFLRKATYKWHVQRKHSKIPFQCEICQKNFASPVSLKTHKRIHTQNKHFICNLCGKGFIQSYSLKVHMRVHTQEKPFKCDLCDKQYSQSFPLTLHKRKHHNK